MSSGLYSHTTRGVGTVLTAAIYNADHVNHVTNHNPSQMGGYSDSVAEMQIATNPGGLGSEVLASNLADELAHLRFVIARLMGTTHWYQAPVTTLATIGGGIPLTLAFAATPLTLRRTENDTTEREILSHQSGSGVGNKYSKRIVGTGSNAVGEVREYIGAVEMLRRSATLITHQIATYFSSYTDIIEIATPANPAPNIARLYARDDGSGLTKLCYRDSAGTEHIITTPPSVTYGAYQTDEYTSTANIGSGIPVDITTPTSSEGTQILNADITLNKATSKVLIKITGTAFMSVSGTFVIALFKGSICIGARCQTIDGYHMVDVEFEDTPGVVGPITYSVRVGSNVGTLSFNNLLGTPNRTKMILREVVLS